jgi:hypothetical protein
MSFAEPRPHRRPFNGMTGTAPLTINPKQAGGNLALTSLTASSQEGVQLVRLVSKKDDSEKTLLEVYVPGGETLHLSFPHPLMIGADHSLVVGQQFNTGALIKITVVGYEWNEKDTISFLFKVGKLLTDLVRRKDP